MARNTLGEDVKPRKGIRWTKKDIANLKREVKNFNSRLRSAQLKYGTGAVFLPEKQTTKDYKNRFQTRDEFNEYLRLLRAGTAKTFQPETITTGQGSEKEVRITSKFLLSKEKLEYKGARRRASRLSEVAAKLQGTHQEDKETLADIVRDEYNTEDRGMFPDDATLLKRRLSKTKGRTLEQKIKNLGKELNPQSVQRWKDNYINSMYEKVTQYMMVKGMSEGGIENVMSSLDRLRRIVYNTSPEAFYLAMGLDPLTSFTFHYDTAVFVQAIDRIVSEWERFEGL